MAPAAFKRFLIFLHRWLGVALCLLFLLWFASGIVMMYTDFPAVLAEDRLERSPALDASAVRLSPAEAAAKIDSRKRNGPIRLNTFDGRPVYRFGTGRGERLIYADNGEEQRAASPEQIARAAARWTSQPVAAAKVEFVREVDQWTVEGPLRSLRPLLKYSWPNGDQLYIAGANAEVVQYTTRVSRFWAYLGPIPHWLYFTPLRQRQLVWSRAVVWTSGAGTVAALIGLTIAAWTCVPRTGIPYRGQKRWHTILGLIFGLTAATWVFSGMLSMDPFGAPAERNPDIAAPLRARAPIGDYDIRAPLATLAGAEVKELELSSFLGDPVYLATLAQVKRAPSRRSPSTASWPPCGTPSPPPTSACSIPTTPTTATATAVVRCRLCLPNSTAPATTSTPGPRASWRATAGDPGPPVGSTTACTRSISRGSTNTGRCGTSS